MTDIIEYIEKKTGKAVEIKEFHDYGKYVTFVVKIEIKDDVGGGE